MKPSNGQTLCWTCKNAVPDGEHGCRWSQHLEPVDGWTATETRVYSKTNLGDTTYKESYYVIDCPEYDPDDNR